MKTRTPERPTSGVIYVRKQDRFWPRKVTLGPRNDNDVLVTRGLKPGEIVAVEPPPPLLIGPSAQPARRAHGSNLLSLLSWRVRQ